MYYGSLNCRGRLLQSISAVPYIKRLIDNQIIDIGLAESVTIVGHTMKGDKYAVEFDRDIFLDTEDDFNNGCHGKGTMNRCLYIPIQFILVEEAMTIDEQFSVFI